MAADFQLTVGTHKTCVPSAKGPDGSAVSFPEGSVFSWTSSDPNIEFNDATAPSPDIVATGPTDPNNPAVITMSVQEAGFSHSASHTVDAVAAPVDTIASVDFTIQ